MPSNVPVRYFEGVMLLDDGEQLEETPGLVATVCRQCVCPFLLLVCVAAHITDVTCAEDDVLLPSRGNGV